MSEHLVICGQLRYRILLSVGDRLDSQVLLLVVLQLRLCFLVCVRLLAIATVLLRLQLLKLHAQLVYLHHSLSILCVQAFVLRISLTQLSLQVLAMRFQSSDLKI